MKLTPEEKQKRKEERAEKRNRQKALNTLEAERQQKPVSRIVMEIEWHKSRTWGPTPYLKASVYFKDGSYEVFNTSTAGCGYDKTSTVVATVFNTYLKYKLHALTAPQSASLEDYLQLYAHNKRLKVLEGHVGRDDSIPYGVSLSDYKELPYCYYDGGIGVSCYYVISLFIGGSLDPGCSSKTFDSFIYVDNE